MAYLQKTVESESGQHQLKMMSVSTGAIPVGCLDCNQYFGWTHEPQFDHWGERRPEFIDAVIGLFDSHVADMDAIHRGHLRQPEPHSDYGHAGTKYCPA